MVWVLLRGQGQSRTPQFPVLTARRGTRSQEGSKPTQLTWTGPRDIPDHQSGVVSNSIVNNLSFLRFSSLFIFFFLLSPFPLKLFYHILLSKCLCFILFQLLNRSFLSPQASPLFPCSAPIQWQRMVVAVVFSCLLGLNHHSRWDI